MSNIKWTGIEQWKYGLTARWYVSAYYGNDTDVDAVGPYNPSTNPTGHGGPTRPFATIAKYIQSGTGYCILDSGYYVVSQNMGNTRYLVGDGVVVVNFQAAAQINVNEFINITTFFLDSVVNPQTDVVNYFAKGGGNSRGVKNNNIYIEAGTGGTTADTKKNNIWVNSSATLVCSGENSLFVNNIIINSPNLTIDVSSIRPAGNFVDYCIIIGTVKTNIPINGKTTGVTVEDFKADGRYFVKSYSEVDIFGNPQGSGATVNQLNQIFNNYYSPIYIDDYQNLDLTLRPDCDERVRFGGLNGTYIGALPVGYRLSASELWNTHIDSGNTSNLAYDMVNNAIVLASGQDVGTYTSLIIDLGAPIVVDMVDFLANFVYNIEGTAKQGVSNQRIDTTPDLLPDNTENQRVVYDYRLQYSPDGVTGLTGWENLELNRMPTKDGDGLYQLEDGFDQATAQKLTIQRLKIEFTLRRVIIG